MDASTNKGPGIESTNIRVLIVADRAVVRRGVAALLQAFGDLQQVGEAVSGPEVIRLCGRLRPDVVLIGLDAPGTNGIAATRAIRQRYPDVQVIALDDSPHDEIAKAVVHSGAIGYLLEDVSADELAAAIRAAHAGRSTWAPEVTQALMRSAVMQPSPGYELTSREREILGLMIQGLRNTEIARRLVVGRSTVKFHVSNILTKLGVSTRTEAVSLALRRGLVE